MIIDSSAIVAILSNEPERRVFTEAIEQAHTCFMSAATFVETSIVIEGSRGYDGLRDFDLFMATATIELVPVDAEQAHIARQAFRQYGKRHHPAGLNFADCFAYALSKVTELPLLFKGNDFSKTDIVPAVTTHDSD
jgi:ribonuclease VapC